MSLKKKLKASVVLIFFFQWGRAAAAFFKFRPFLFFKTGIWFWTQYSSFKKQKVNPNFLVKIKDIFPCLLDNVTYTPLDPIYFYQDSWAAGKIFKLKPHSHIDVGSSAKTVGILSQFVPVTMVDIRPIKLTMEGLNFIKGSIVELPFENNSVESISSLCVVEHIGLGRYGDPIDPWGSEKAIKELRRVVRTGGFIFFSVPVDETSKVYFNAHRAFSRSYLLSLFEDCELIEERYIYGTALELNYDPLKGYGVGLYMFRKK